MNGAFFRNNSIILIGIDQDDNPSFATVRAILTLKKTDEVRFYAQKMTCEIFDPHYYAYQAHTIDEFILVQIQDLYQPAIPHSKTVVLNETYITCRLMLG